MRFYFIKLRVHLSIYIGLTLVIYISSYASGKLVKRNEAPIFYKVLFFKCIFMILIALYLVVLFWCMVSMRKSLLHLSPFIIFSILHLFSFHAPFAWWAWPFFCYIGPSFILISCNVSWPLPFLKVPYGNSNLKM